MHQQLTQRAGKLAVWRSALGAPTIALLVLLAGLWRLGSPPMWWDEGWTLAVARNIVERDIYARLRDGQPVAHGLEAAVPVTELVALSFRLFGVGVWQGRVPGVICAALALLLLYALARRAYDRAIAGGAIASLLLLSIHPQLNLLVQGRQVLAELPMLCALLGGYLCCHLAARRHLWTAVLAAVLWALALIVKAQTLPFWVASLAIGLLAALALRRRRYALTLGIGLAGSYALYPWLARVFNQLANQPLTPDSVSGLYEVIAFVPSLFNRTYALGVALMFGLPALLGLAHGAWRLASDVRGALRVPPEGAATDALVMRAALLGLAGSWMAWFLLLSVGVPRYMFPPVFLGSAFVAALLCDLTGGFSLAATLERLVAPLRGRPGRAAAGAWLAALLVAAALPLTLLTYQRYYLTYSDDSAQQVAAFFNSATPPDTLIETYESELHFLLDRPYHWPPDQVHIELNRRSLLGEEQAVDYDPLAADPDYLVVGEFARGNGLYEPAIASGAFRLLRSYGGYDLYERAR